MAKAVLILKRDYKKNQYTIGNLYLNGKWICNTLEDKVIDLTKEKKIYGETAIPAGSYEIIHHVSPKFGKCLWVLNVPYFQGILFHAGNTAKDTHGCILVGINKQKGMLMSSRMTLNFLLKELEGIDDIELIIEN